MRSTGTGAKVEGGKLNAVDTSAGPIACDIVVNAAGAWATQTAVLVFSADGVPPVGWDPALAALDPGRFAAEMQL